MSIRLPFDPVAETVERLARHYDNLSGPGREGAVKAETEGRAVFWTSAGFDDQRCTGLVQLANTVNLPHAMVEYFGADRRTDHAFATPEYVLDRLIPLNRSAAMQMRAEYALVGTFRTVDELLRRNRAGEALQAAE